MLRSLFPTCVLIVALSGGGAFAQLFPPGGSLYNPPPPAPPPPPRIEVPPVPKIDGPRSAHPNVRSSRRNSFGDRMSRCLDEGAALGLNQSDRATYARSCANLRD
ncbi:hypothetical protein [Bradyrhizobium lablabi]|uniref:hypothetical protein n=1 Tax=Bradyrhizobium lablabi TaxID=722472 RepID=UPI001BAC4532|nr:hypothetical protein [Bradyrhizobium lablabi]MBR0692623.1 hypothetical protein [Bradyrhizobium lablabi]